MRSSPPPEPVFPPGTRHQRTITATLLPASKHGANSIRFMDCEQVQKEQGASHEPERGHSCPRAPMITNCQQKCLATRDCPKERTRMSALHLRGSWPQCAAARGSWNFPRTNGSLLLFPCPSFPCPSFLCPSFLCRNFVPFVVQSRIPHPTGGDSHSRARAARAAAFSGQSCSMAGSKPVRYIRGISAIRSQKTFTAKNAKSAKKISPPACPTLCGLVAWLFKNPRSSLSGRGQMVLLVCPQGNAGQGNDGQGNFSKSGFLFLFP